MQYTDAVCKFIEHLFWVAACLLFASIIIIILSLPLLPPAVELLIRDENRKDHILVLIEQIRLLIARYYMPQTKQLKLEANKES